MDEPGVIMFDLIRRPVAALLVPLLLATSCGPLPRELKRDLRPPPQRPAADAQAPYLLAHMRDGRAIVLDSWTIRDSTRTVFGMGRVLDANRAKISEGPVRIGIDEVALFETNVVQNSASVAGLAIISGASAALTVFCLTNTKACFGSCPTFYAPDGDGGPLVLQAEGFSDSVAPALEKRDVDALFRTRPGARALQVRMTNEALETHVIKEANILAVPAPAGGRVFAAGDFPRLRLPAVCVRGGLRKRGARRAPSPGRCDDADVCRRLGRCDGASAGTSGGVERRRVTRHD